MKYIPGSDRDLARVIEEIRREHDQRLALLERKGGRAGVVISSTAANIGEFLNIAGSSSETIDIVLPESTQARRNGRVTLAFRNSNPVRIVAINGTVNGETFVLNDRPGTYDAICDGLGGWAVQVGVSEAGSGAGGGGGSVATDLAGLSVLGRAPSTTGAMAAITATEARQVLRNRGDQLHWEFPLTVGSPFVWLFDGSNDQVSMGDVLDITPTTPISVFGWYSTTATTGQTFVAKQSAASAVGWRFVLSSTTDDLILDSGTRSLSCGPTSRPPRDGSENLFGFTYDGSSSATGVTFYVNNASVGKTTNVNTLLSGDTISNAQPLQIGLRGTTAPMNGGLRHISIWNRVLTPSEQLQVYGSGAPPDLSALSFFSDCIGWWKLDETDTTGAGGVADHSASNNDGTAAGGLAPTGGSSQVHSLQASGSGVSVSVLDNVASLAREALTGDITAPAGSNVTDIAPGVIVNADVNASAAIAQTKLGATTGFSVKASGASATTSAEPIVTYSASANMSAERVTTSSISVTVSTSVAGQIEFQRAALTGDVTASANSNATAIAPGVIVDADVNAAAAIAQTKTGALTGDVTKASGSDATAIAAGVIVDADISASAAIAHTKLADIPAISVLGNPLFNGGSPGPVTTIASAGTGQVLRDDGAGNIGFGALLSTSFANAIISRARLTDMAAGTVVGRLVGSGTGAPSDLTGLEQGQNLRRGTAVTDTTSTGTIVTYTVAETTTQVLFQIGVAITIRGFSIITGKTLVLACDTGFAGTVTLNHEDGSSAATGERIRCPGAANYTFGADQTVTLERFSNRWRIIAIT
jgi:hypothetical protein